MKLRVTMAALLTATCVVYPAWAQESGASGDQSAAEESAPSTTPPSDSPDDKADAPDEETKAPEPDTTKDQAAPAAQAASASVATTTTTTTTTPVAATPKSDETESTVKADPDAKPVPSTEGVTPPERSTLGLAPGAPEIAALPGGVTPAFGSQGTRPKEAQFEFHGMVYLPLRFGIATRENAGGDQKKTVLHAPPRVPGDFETFGYTSTVPNPWTQLNFSYGNQTVMATVIVAARTVTNANGYFDPPDMLGINDAFLTFRTTLEKLKLELNIGAFANRYGQMGEYDLGRFGTPLIARVSGTGLTGTGMLALGNVTLMLEAGFQGQFNKAPVGVEPAGWNGFADPNAGSSFAGHGHLGINFKKIFELGGHIISTFNQDDRASTQDQPDGNIMVAGVDARLTAGRFGHLYLGYARTDAQTARSVSSVVRVLNAPGGLGLMDNYLGPDSEGTGTLDTVGAQFDLSLGNLLRYPSPFEGNGPDLLLSAFTIFTHVNSPNDPSFDGINKVKVGGELGYSMLRWLALGARYDHVMPDPDEAALSHGIVTGRIIFHSDWSSRDQVVLQYSFYRNGYLAEVREGYPPEDVNNIEPDAHVLSLTASMWW